MNAKDKAVKKEILSYKHKAGIFLISLSTLLLEYTLIRVLSVSLWYHFAFMIISVALLGFGISGVTILISDKINKAEINRYLTITSFLYAISILISFSLMNRVPFDPFSLFEDSLQFVYLPIYYLLITLPFFLGGLVIGQLFTRFKSDINKLYFFDLIGAGLGCFAFIIILPLFGGSGGIAFASLIAAVACIVFASEKNKLQTVGIFAASVLIIIDILFLTKPDLYLPISVSANKVYAGIIEEKPELRILTKWNTFSKVDVIKDEDPPVDAYPVYTAIIDAGNSTTNIPKVPFVYDSMPHPLDASNLAMILKSDSANVFVVGSGGGGEVLSALTHHARTVTAVEINGILNDLIEEDFAPYWTTGIAKDKNVKFITDDARSWLRGKRIKYDVIISAHTISASATASGAMSLVENYIMTEEALEDYLYHLKPDGILYISRPETQMSRLVTSIKIAHHNMGAMDLKNQFYIFKRPPNEFEKDVSFLTGVLYKKDGFTDYDIQVLKTQAALLGLENVYDPVSKQEGIYKDLIETNNIYETIKKYPTNLLPATDDNPYFEHMTKFSDLNLKTIKESFSQTDRAIITLIQKPVAESTLLVLFIQVLIISGLLIFLPIYLKFRKNPEYKETKKWPYLLYFAALGTAYIMIEICLIQNFTLFLGQPVYTMLTVISTMLIFSGLGSLLSSKILKLFKGNNAIIYIIIAVLTATIALVNPILFTKFVRIEPFFRILISIGLIAPLSFFMGIPFPLGISKIQTNSRYLVAYSWGVNGFFSVIGSVLVVMLSMSYGFKVVFMASAAIYLLSMFLVKKINPVQVK
jgi:hypothetical protein